MKKISGILRVCSFGLKPPSDYRWPTGRPGTGPWQRGPCHIGPQVGPRSMTRITGYVSPRSVTLCIHKQITVSHSQSQITESKFHNSYIHRSHHHSFLHSQNQSPKLQMSDTFTVSYIYRIEVQMSDTFTDHSSYIHIIKVQSRQITEITKMSCLVQCCLIKKISR